MSYKRKYLGTTIYVQRAKMEDTSGLGQCYEKDTEFGDEYNLANLGSHYTK